MYKKTLYLTARDWPNPEKKKSVSFCQNCLDIPVHNFVHFKLQKNFVILFTPPTIVLAGQTSEDGSWI